MRRGVVGPVKWGGGGVQRFPKTFVFTNSKCPEIFRQNNKISENLHFISFLPSLGGYLSAKLVFKGPSFKKKKYICKVKYNPIINKEKK